MEERKRSGEFRGCKIAEPCARLVLDDTHFGRSREEEWDRETISVQSLPPF